MQVKNMAVVNLSFLLWNGKYVKTGIMAVTLTKIDKEGERYFYHLTI